MSRAFFGARLAAHFFIAERKLLMAEPDYQKLYHQMVGQTERAIEILIQAQRDCEEAVLNAAEEADTPRGEAQ